MQLPLFTPKKTWTPSLYFLPIQQAKRICIDVETKDPDLKNLGPGVRRRGSYIVGIGIAIDRGPSVYYPIRHEGGDNLDKDTVIDWCFREFKKYKGEVVGANLLYDLDWFGSEGIYFNSECRFLDVQYAEALIDENRLRYNLNSLAKEYLGTTKREEELNRIADLYGIDPKSELWRLPGGYVGRYALGDVEIPLDILRLQEQKIEQQNLQQIWKLETDLLPVMLAMRQKGIRIDEAKLEECEKYFATKEKSALFDIYTETGIQLKDQLWVAESLADILRKLKIDFPLTEKTKKPSIKSDWLKTIDHPVTRNMAQARRFNKARTMFCESIKSHMTYGRIHPNFNQLKGDEVGTVSGRLSCNHPNIQQQPIRDKEIGRMFRSIYLSDEGYQYGCFDYKEQEPKIALHYAILSKLSGTQNLLKKYAKNPDIDSYGLISHEIPRADCKVVYLTMLYGGGGLKICEQLKLSTAYREDRKGSLYECAGPEAQGIIDNFERGAPYIIELIRKVTRSARSKGFVKTILGRRCRFPDLDWVYKATNRLIQGSAADQTKQALIDLYAAGYTPHLQVHDEVGISISDEKQAIEIKEIMEQSVKLKIPALVDCTLGANWGDCK